MPISINQNKKSRLVLVIFFSGLFLRLYVALASDFLLEKDEVMQYLEQGHRLAYGYGLIPWEYRVDIRPLLIPYFISICLKIFNTFGIAEPKLYIPGIKIVFCMLSMSIPLGMYQFCKKNYSQSVGVVALFIGCIWYELIITAHKPLSEFISTDLVLLGLYFFNKNEERTSHYIYIATVLCCLSVSIRPHIAPAVVVVLIFYYFNKTNKIINNGLFLLFFSIILIGAIEFISYGTPWLSYYNYFYYNIVLKLSSNFGVTSGSYYFLSFLFTSIGIFYVSMLYGMIKIKTNANLLIISCLLLIIIEHLTIPHKEYRFIYTTIPLWLIIFAQLLTSLSYSKRQFNKILAIFSIVSWFGFVGLLPEQNLVYQLINHKDYSYFKKSDSLSSYVYLSSLNDTGSVFDFSNTWLTSGGYYYLHHNVPLIHTKSSPDSHTQILKEIYSTIEKNIAKYIVTYEQVTSKNLKLIKKIGNINLYESLTYKKSHSINDYNRYIKNVPF